jgi:hypothetical protein
VIALQRYGWSRFGCGAYLPPRLMAIHTREGCPKRLVECGFDCGVKVWAEELLYHQVCCSLTANFALPRFLLALLLLSTRFLFRCTSVQNASTSAQGDVGWY